MEKIMKINGRFTEFLKIGILLAAIIASFYSLKTDVKVLEAKIIMMEKQLDKIEGKINP